MTKKRRARAGEVRLWDLSVIAYREQGPDTYGRDTFYGQTRVTIRGAGTTVEASSYWPLVALIRAFLKHRRVTQSPDVMLDRLETAARELGPVSPPTSDNRLTDQTNG
jgi:hypothetical protein